MQPLQLFAILTFLACVPLSSCQADDLLPEWGQCGGTSGVCGKTGWGPCEDKVWDSPSCPPGFTCIKDTEFYYQCLPGDGESQAEVSAPPAPTVPAAPGSSPSADLPVDGVLPAWAQCGGTAGVCGEEGWGDCEDRAWPGLSCPTGFSCVRDTQYYHQCQPEGEASSAAAQSPPNSPESSESSAQEELSTDTGPAYNPYLPIDGVLPEWGQCGGESGECGQAGWGPCVDRVWATPVCPTNWTCWRDTQYYYQCLPAWASQLQPPAPEASSEASTPEMSEEMSEPSPSPAVLPSPSPGSTQPNRPYAPVNGVVPQWAQCGGQGGVCNKTTPTGPWGPCVDQVWDTPVCPYGWTCARSSQYYYQCLPRFTLAT